MHKQIALQQRLVSALEAQIAAAECPDLRDELRADLEGALEELYYLEELAADNADLEDY
jgi:hypothetical protein